MDDVLISMRETYDIINKHFPNKKEFKVADLLEAIESEYGKGVRRNKDVGAAASHLVNVGLLNRIKSFSGPGTYTTYQITGKKWEERLSAKRSRRAPTERLSQRHVIEIIKEKFGGNAWSQEMLREALGLGSTVQGRINTLIKRKLVEQAKSLGRARMFQLIVAEKENKAGVKTEQPVETDSERDRPKSIVPERKLRQFTVDKEDPAIISKDMLDFFDIPLSLLGDAIYLKIRDMKRHIISLEEREARLTRENESMSKRMTEQFKQIQALNNRIIQLNEEARRPKAGDKTVKFGDIVRVGHLRK